MKVAIIGASNKPDRYSYKAMQSLQKNGHEVFLVNPVLKEVEGVAVYPSLSQLSDIDTVTVYVGADRSSPMQDELLSLKPKRVIFNPGAENDALAKTLEENGVEILSACTLVMLATDQF